MSAFRLREFARGVISCILLMAGIRKLQNLGMTKATMVAFGIPQKYHKTTAILLIAAELTVAVLLLVPMTTVLGASLAAAMFGVFTGVIVRQLSKGNRPACGCFGQSSVKPIGFSAVARNCVLGGASMAIAWPKVGGRFRYRFSGGADGMGRYAGILALVISVVSLALILRMTKRFGDVIISMQPPKPSVRKGDLAENLISLVDIDPAVQSQLVVFASEGCVHCHELYPKLAKQIRPVVIVISGSSRDSIVSLQQEYPGINFLWDEGANIAKTFNVSTTPTAFLVNHDGVLLHDPWMGADVISRELAKQ